MQNPAHTLFSVLPGGFRADKMNLIVSVPRFIPKVDDLDVQFWPELQPGWVADWGRGTLYKWKLETFCSLGT